MKAEEAERELSTGGYQSVRAHDGSLLPAFQPDSSRAQAIRATRAVLSVGLAVVVLTCVVCLLSARSQPDLQMASSESLWQPIRISLPRAWSNDPLHRQNEKLPSLANVFQTPTPTGSIYNPHFSHDGASVARPVPNTQPHSSGFFLSVR